MKPSAFEYVRPTTKQQVLELLAESTDSSKILAGGQSLVPMMNFRLARPSRLIDINEVPDLDTVEVAGGRLKLGSRTRHIRLQNHRGGDPLAKLLRRAACQVGHLPIRVRGTFGGSLAHSDAASEWCLVATLLDAQIGVESMRGRRVIGASDFFQSIFTTSMNDDELLVDVSLPVLGDNHQVGFVEFARRAGDFAIVAVGVDLDITDGRVEAARICIGGVDETPFRAVETENLLVGADWSTDAARASAIEAAAATARTEVSPPSDTHGDAEYRRDLVNALVGRALNQGNSS